METERLQKFQWVWKCSSVRAGNFYWGGGTVWVVEYNARYALGVPPALLPSPLLALVLPTSTRTSYGK